MGFTPAALASPGSLLGQHALRHLPRTSQVIHAPAIVPETLACISVRTFVLMAQAVFNTMGEGVALTSTPVVVL